MPEEKLEQPEVKQPEELIKLLQANLERSNEILEISKDIKSFIRWQNVWSILRFVLIVVPIVLGFIYLPPLIKDAIQSYKSLLIP